MLKANRPKLDPREGHFWIPGPRERIGFRLGDDCASVADRAVTSDQ